MAMDLHGVCRRRTDSTVRLTRPNHADLTQKERTTLLSELFSDQAALFQLSAKALPWVDTLRCQG